MHADLLVVHLDIPFEGLLILDSCLIDLRIDDTGIVEAKAVEGLTPIHQAPFLTHLRLSGTEVGRLLDLWAGPLNLALRHEGGLSPPVPPPPDGVVTHLERVGGGPNLRPRPAQGWGRRAPPGVPAEGPEPPAERCAASRPARAGQGLGAMGRRAEPRS
ncbi:GxxExxY protein [Mesoterricola sediminis]|uniref:GxxExxY protein n=1 Tax=Mesoterricola sediminis TaxID=2927980 RepID=UPI003744111C